MPDEKKTCKCCDKKEEPVEIKEEDLESISGGAASFPMAWRCKYCGTILTINSQREACDHWTLVCPSSPYR